MNANQVVEKILADAQAEVDKILSAASDELAKQQTKFDQQLKDYQDETDKLAQAAAEDKTQRMMAAARMKASKEELKVKHLVIEDVFAASAEKLLSLDDKSYLASMESLLLKAVETGDEEVLAAEGEKHINADFVKAVNAKLADKGKLTFSADKCKGNAGFILRRGNIRTNVTVDVLLSQARAELEIEISKELFSN